MSNIKLTYSINSVTIDGKATAFGQEKIALLPRQIKGAHVRNYFGEIYWLGIRIAPYSPILARSDYFYLQIGRNGSAAKIWLLK